MEKRHLAAQLFDKYAARYQEKYMDVQLYHDGLRLYCQGLRQGSVAVLDVGCGPGNVSRFLLDQRPELELMGIDLAPSMVALAKENNPEASFKVMDALDVAQLPQHYAGIVIGFCLPYLSREETEQLLAASLNRLEPGGSLYLSTMEGDYGDSDWNGPSTGEADRLFTYYHDGEFLNACLSKLGYTDIHIQRQQFEQADGQITWDLICLAKKPRQ